MEMHDNDTTKERFFIKKILDIRYRNNYNENIYKQITIDTKIVPYNQNEKINQLRELLEGEVIIIYHNNMYTKNHYANKYKKIIESNIDKEKLIYVSQYYYLDSYQL